MRSAWRYCSSPLAPWPACRTGPYRHRHGTRRWDGRWAARSKIAESASTTAPAEGPPDLRADRPSLYLAHGGALRPRSPAISEAAAMAWPRRWRLAPRCGKFRELVAYQGGGAAVIDDPSKLPVGGGAHRCGVAASGGFVTAIDADPHRPGVDAAGRDATPWIKPSITPRALSARQARGCRSAGDPSRPCSHNDGGRRAGCRRAGPGGDPFAPAAGALPGARSAWVRHGEETVFA